jgi:hypothetical protein
MFAPQSMDRIFDKLPEATQWPRDKRDLQVAPCN